MPLNLRPSPFRSLCLALGLGALGLGCALAPEDAAEVGATASPLLSALPEISPNSYGIDGDNVYLQVQIGAEYGAFLAPIGAGVPVLLDPGGSGRRSYFFQVSGGDLYYVAELYTAGVRTPRYELRRVAAGTTTPVTELEVPMWASIAVGATDVYLQTSSTADGRYQSLYRLPRTAGATATKIAPSEDSARDLVVVGGRAFWRAGWAGLSQDSLYLATYDPATDSVTRVPLASGTAQASPIRSAVAGGSGRSDGSGGLDSQPDKGSSRTLVGERAQIRRAERGRNDFARSGWRSLGLIVQQHREQSLTLLWGQQAGQLLALRLCTVCSAEQLPRTSRTREVRALATADGCA